MVRKLTLCYTLFIQASSLQVFAIELVTFAIGHVLLAIEFVVFVIQFVAFALKFVTLALKLVLAIEFDAFASELIAFAQIFVCIIEVSDMSVLLLFASGIYLWCAFQQGSVKRSDTVLSLLLQHNTVIIQCNIQPLACNCR